MRPGKAGLVYETRTELQVLYVHDQEISFIDWVVLFRSVDPSYNYSGFRNAAD